MAWTMPIRGNGGDGAGRGLVAFPIRYEGPDAYAKAFTGTGYGLVLDDDGETGYLYVTTEDFAEVHDTLHLYNSDMEESPEPGDTIYIVWSPTLLRAGVFFREAYFAIVDLANARACCLSGYPEPAPGGWCRSSHKWDPELEEGMTFDKIGEQTG